MPVIYGINYLYLSNLYFIMSDVKPDVNAKTSILGRQYTMTVTFDGSLLCLNASFWAENVLKMSQNGKLLILITKAMIKQLETSEKWASLIIQGPVHDGNPSIRKVE